MRRSVSARSSSWCKRQLGRVLSAAARSRSARSARRRATVSTASDGGRGLAPGPHQCQLRLPAGRARPRPPRRGTRGRPPHCSRARRFGPEARQSLPQPRAHRPPAPPGARPPTRHSVRPPLESARPERKRLERPGLPQHRLVPLLVVRPADLGECAVQLPNPQEQPAPALRRGASASCACASAGRPPRWPPRAPAPAPDAGGPSRPAPAGSSCSCSIRCL